MNIGLLIKQSGFSKSCDGTDSYVGDYEDFERLTKAIRAEALAEQEKQEPVYAFRRRGLDDFCTCTKERYEELVDKPNLFEVTTFYAAPVDAKAIRAEALEEAAKVAESVVAKQSKHINDGKPFYANMYWEEIAAAIRGLK